jgi:predicted enzyme related to lactoylglutathione lyase
VLAPTGAPDEEAAVTDGEPLRPMLAYVTLSSVMPQRLIDFYTELLGKQVTFDDPPFTVIGGGEPRPVALAFQQVHNGHAPTPVHIDLQVADIDAAGAEVQRLGGRLGDRHEEVGSRWRQAFDPDGNVFCLLSAAAPPDQG